MDKKQENPLRVRLYQLASEVIRYHINGIDSINNFSLACEQSGGWAKNFNAQKFLPKTLSAIKRRFPVVDIDWLVTGEGKMFVVDDIEAWVAEQEKENEEDKTKILESKIDVLYSQVAQLLKLNQELQDKVDRLEKNLG